MSVSVAWQRESLLRKELTTQATIDLISTENVLIMGGNIHSNNKGLCDREALARRVTLK